jgi:hypothetical protein
LRPSRKRDIRPLVKIHYSKPEIFYKFSQYKSVIRDLLA